MTDYYNDTAALIPAAGMGTRLGLGPKAFLKINGKTLLRIVVEKLSRCVPRIIAAVPPGFVGQGEEEVGNIAEVIEGGASRQETIFKLLNQCSEDIVLTHDVTRPFASLSLMNAVICAARASGAAIGGIPSQIPIMLCENGSGFEIVSKERFMIPQSPQAFRREILTQAYQYALSRNIETQTTLEIVEMIGKAITIVPGEEKNIKITTPFDWAIASQILAPEIE